jgi:hypothetical protein
MNIGFQFRTNGVKQPNQVFWTMTILRVGIDGSNEPCVDVRINETDEKRRLYAGDTLEMKLKVIDEVEKSQ